ncbi:Cif family virulence factor [Tenacibaculum agarivorans]|uniref:nuclear transport factor 2 family protein n=1 Tax=Tenacibaculum agarivorans TaxID=1908389 RepID=UPI00094B81C9|nr:nuclear transport factor 2 family protein [Tenacibaculum agarivorans]
MKKLILLLVIIICSCSKTTSEIQEKKEIIAIMKQQETDWSDNNIEGFMEGYWKSDSLKFYGSSGITYGWQKTLDNYKKSYPTKDHTGTLKFKINSMAKIEHNSYYVMGEYHLTRTKGNADGVFMIIFKKINGEWKIIADTSC